MAYKYHLITPSDREAVTTFGVNKYVEPPGQAHWLQSEFTKNIQILKQIEN